MADQTKERTPEPDDVPTQVTKASQDAEQSPPQSSNGSELHEVAERRGVVDRRNIDRRTLDEASVAGPLYADPATRPAKDGWDKIAAVAPIISGTLIFLMGGWFTYTFNQQQLRLQEVQTIERFIPHLMGNEQSKKAAILAISAMTNPELAGKFASIFASSGTVSALQKIASSGNEKEKSAAEKALSDALETLASRESKLDDIASSYQNDLVVATQKNASNADMAYKMNKLAQVYTLKGQYALAEPLFKRSLDLREQLYGADNPMIAEVLNGMAEMYHASGKPDLAETCLKRARAIEGKAAQQPPPGGPMKPPAPAAPEPLTVVHEQAPIKEPENEQHPAAGAPESKPHTQPQRMDSKTRVLAPLQESHPHPQTTAPAADPPAKTEVEPDAPPQQD